MDSAMAAALQREVYRNEPYFLGKDVLGFNKFCETQLEWSAWLKSIFCFNPQRRAMALKMAPRETFKSTFFIVTVAIFALLQNPNMTILIACKTQGNADAHLKEIKSKLTSDTFKSVFGDLTGSDVWRDDAINIRSRTYHTKEASIEAAGIGKSLTGKHYDFIIADDLVTQEDRDSAAERLSTFNFFNGLFDVLKKESGQLLMTGTRWHRDDLYNHIIEKVAPELERKNLWQFHVSVVPAHAEDGKLNYPRLLPESRLLELKTVKQGADGMDISTFMAQYELCPLSPNEQIFKTFHYYDATNCAYEMFVLFTDPALSDKGTACYSATVVLGKLKDSGGKWGVAYASILKREPTQIIRDHNRIYRMHRDLYSVPVMAYMETNGFQMLLRNEAIAKAADEGDPVPTMHRQNSDNKESRIRSMEPFISQGFLVFRQDWETAPEGYRMLIEQLQSFPQGKVDGPDAMQSAHKQTQSRYLA